MQSVGRQSRFGGAMLALLLIGIILLVADPAARAENLDEGKPAAKLFSDGCSACHHRARGLAKGRFTVTLYLFLQQHYASNSSSAWALASYLESLDGAPRGQAQSARTRHAPSRAPGSLQRPPMPIPQH
jgi:mono/diheme cytochrome c family protein